ncbi:MAG: 3-oxoacyl-ACP reductase FabG [Eubacteriales bacterium]|nr:3-oxoacyl-ACP reductase FabG [Eubacteriales bacterium]
MRRTVLVTGGSRGIGAACVSAFARAGWSVVFLYRRAEEAAESLCARLRGEGLDVSCRRCDVSRRDEVFRTVDDLMRTYHRFDALVNNAGVAHIGLFTDMTEEQWDALFAVNLKGAFNVTQAVLPGMISQGSGAIVNVSSMWGEVGASCEVAYSAAKAALIGMTKALAKEVGPSGVRVNCVSPGVIDTDMNAELTEADLAALAEETPLGRIGRAEEVANATLYLCGEGASFITGQTLGVSGGLVV